MFTTIVPSEKVNPNLFSLVKTMAAYLSCKVEIKPQVIITTDNPKLVEMVNQVLGLRAEPPSVFEKPVEIFITPPQIKSDPTGASGKTCKYCGDPVPSAHSKICGKEECKAKRQAEYDAAHKAKKNGNVPPPIETPATPTGAEPPLAGQ